MWWLLLILLLFLLFLSIYLNPAQNSYKNARYDSSINQEPITQIAGGIGSPRNYLIYANGTTIDPNNSIAVIANMDPLPSYVAIFAK